MNRSELMFDLAARISAFDVLGSFLSQYKNEKQEERLQKLNAYFLPQYRQVIQEAGIYNNWFTPQNVEFALEQWSRSLQANNLMEWTRRYSSDIFDNNGSSTIALIMAGNIPLVGFHDLLCVLISGHKVLIKPSSEDSKLIPFIAQILVAIDERFAPYIRFAEGRLQEFDAVIATGSNNSSRYFDYYFSKYPHIIRKNRSSVAIIRKEESEEDLKLLGEDVFRYFGLGCRNVSKIYIPEEFDLDRIFKAFYPFHGVVENNKYGNNFDYNRAIYLMERIPFLENGFIILRENTDLHAPASVLYYEYYKNLAAVEGHLQQRIDEIQCVAAKGDLSLPMVDFGKTQQPELWDYADQVDTLKFLRSV